MTIILQYFFVIFTYHFALNNRVIWSYSNTKHKVINKILKMTLVKQIKGNKILPR